MFMLENEIIGSRCLSNIYNSARLYKRYKMNILYQFL